MVVGFFKNEEVVIVRAEEVFKHHHVTFGAFEFKEGFELGGDEEFDFFVGLFGFVKTVEVGVFVANGCVFIIFNW